MAGNLPEEDEYEEVKVWNPTVANLTLMVSVTILTIRKLFHQSLSAFSTELFLFIKAYDTLWLLLPQKDLKKSHKYLWGGAYLRWSHIHFLLQRFLYRTTVGVR